VTYIAFTSPDHLSVFSGKEKDREKGKEKKEKRV